MARHVVMERSGDAENAVFVRDAFSVPALIFPVVWLLWHRLWFAALAAFAVVALATLIGWRFDLSGLPIAAELAVSAFVALEGATLRRLALEDRGYAEANVIHAASMEEAEIRHFAGRADSPSLPQPPAAPRPVDGRSAFPVFAPARG
jgi:hypothetical protein